MGSKTLKMLLTHASQHSHAKPEARKLPIILFTLPSGWTISISDLSVRPPKQMWRLLLHISTIEYTILSRIDMNMWGKARLRNSKGNEIDYLGRENWLSENKYRMRLYKDSQQCVSVLDHRTTGWVYYKSPLCCDGPTTAYVNTISPLGY